MYDGLAVADYPRKDFEEFAREVLQTKRDTVIELRNEEAINDQALRRIQRDIDLAEARLQRPAVRRLRWREGDPIFPSAAAAYHRYKSCDRMSITTGGLRDENYADVRFHLLRASAFIAFTTLPLERFCRKEGASADKQRPGTAALKGSQTAARAESSADFGQNHGTSLIVTTPRGRIIESRTRDAPRSLSARA